jgi:PHD/YefM family antitoxin component YafN of YafNO toxin-antitoxin module
MTSATIAVNRDAILDLVRVKDEFDSIVESLELMSNPEFMASYKNSRKQVEKRDFVDWNAL